MSDSTPPRSTAPTAKRPIFLVVALALTMLFGAAGWMSGCQTIEEYRTPSDAFERQVEVLPTAEDRDTARASFERYQATLETAKRRQYPFGIAEFLLGAAMLALTARAFGGRPGSRTMLLQVTVAQAVVLVVAYFVTADARDAWLRHMGTTVSLMSPPDSAERLLWRPGVVTAVISAVWSSWTFVRTLLSVMAIVLLTRKSTVTFFDAGEPLSER
jgi:hypothetical protein